MIVAALAGGFLWYTAERAFYEEVAFQPGAEIRLVPLAGNQPEAIIVNKSKGSTRQLSHQVPGLLHHAPVAGHADRDLSGYEGAEPLVAPRRFDCFDAETIAKALESGEALAFLSEPEIHPGVDRVVAVFADGRAFAWHQLNASLDGVGMAEADDPLRKLRRRHKRDLRHARAEGMLQGVVDAAGGVVVDVRGEPWSMITAQLAVDRDRGSGRNRAIVTRSSLTPYRANSSRNALPGPRTCICTPLPWGPAAASA